MVILFFSGPAVFTTTLFCGKTFKKDYLAKAKFSNPRTHDFKQFPRRILKIYTDLLHGISIDQLSMVNLLEILKFLCFEGKTIDSLSPYSNFEHGIGTVTKQKKY